MGATWGRGMAASVRPRAVRGRSGGSGLQSEGHRTAVSVQALPSWSPVSLEAPQSRSGGGGRPHQQSVHIRPEVGLAPQAGIPTLGLSGYRSGRS